MRKSDVKLNVLFEGVEGRFPEPYKASWTEWRMKYRPELTDDQIRELVFLQLAHKISGRPMAELVKTPDAAHGGARPGQAQPQAGAAAAKAKARRRRPRRTSRPPRRSQRARRPAKKHRPLDRALTVARRVRR